MCVCVCVCVCVGVGIYITCSCIFQQSHVVSVESNGAVTTTTKEEPEDPWKATTLHIEETEWKGDSLSPCLSVCLPVCLSVSLSVCLSVCMHVCMYEYMYVCMYEYNFSNIGTCSNSRNNRRRGNSNTTNDNIAKVASRNHNTNNFI